MLLRGRAFVQGAMDRRINPSWWTPIELFLVPAGVLSCLWNGAYKRSFLASLK